MQPAFASPVFLVLAPALAAQDCSGIWGSPSPARTETGDGVSTFHYERRPRDGDFPGPGVWEHVEVDWERPERVVHDCLEFSGRLVVRRPGEPDRPVDWLVGLELLVAERPEDSFEWRGDGPFEGTYHARGLVQSDGTFWLGVHDERKLTVIPAPAYTQVGLRIAESGKKTVRWTPSLPLLESSVTRLELTPSWDDETWRSHRLTEERFQRDWNAWTEEGLPFGFEIDLPRSLLPLPRIRVHEWADADQEVTELIDRLEEVDSPGLGYSPTTSGSTFLPVPSSSWSFGAALFGGPRVREDSALRRLVELGPSALPHLLEHLDDPRPTKLEITNVGGFGVMGFGGNLQGNPLNEIERSLLGEEVLRESVTLSSWMFDPLSGIPPLSEYTVTVGDLCFVAIGQIVNRGSYQAVRYVPSGNQAIWSMEKYPWTVSVLREALTSEDPAQHLFEWLMTDFMTRGFGTDDLQAGAALRLGYYFPDEAGPVLADRLDGLRTDYGTAEPFGANGLLHVGSFLNSVAACRSVAVQRALLRVVLRTEDPWLAGACFTEDPGEDATATRKLIEIAGLLADDGLGVGGDGYQLLWTAMDCGLDPDDLERVFRAFLAPGTLERKRSVCRFFQWVDEPPEWAAALLVPMLDDRTETDLYRQVRPRIRHPCVRVRLCDEAALALARCRDGLEFSMHGLEVDLDRSIAALRQAFEPAEGDR